jgi:predicted nucleotidyltransferase
VKNSQVNNNLNEIVALLKANGVVSASLFGSACEGNDNADFDFLVKFKSDLDYVSYADNYFNLLYALQDLLKKDVDLLAEETISNPYLLKSINRNKIKLL